MHREGPGWRTDRRIIAGGFVLIAWLVSLVGNELPVVGERLGCWSFDLVTVMRSRVRPAEAAIVLMDSASRSRLLKGAPSDPLWNRALHIDLLRQLTAAGARAVVFDIFFHNPWPIPEVDAQLREAIQRHGRVFFAGWPETVERAGGTRVERVWPPNETLGTNLAWGITAFPREYDGAPRRHISHANAPILPEEIVLGLGREVPEAETQQWLNYYGPAESVPTHSYWQVLSNHVGTAALSNRVVFVGQGALLNSGAPHAQDQHATPFTRLDGRLTPGVEVVATAFLNLWRDDSLARVSHLTEAGLLLLTALAFGCSIGNRGSGRRRLALLTVVCLVATAGLVAGKQRLWFAWLTPFVLQWPLTWMPAFRRRAGQRRTENASDGRLPLPAELEATRREAGLGSETPMAPVVSDHQLIRCIGRGAYGAVWLARDVLGGFHAVKIAERATFLGPEPFEREFRGLQKFTPISRGHRGWIHILHVGRDPQDRYFFSIMELGDDRSGQEFSPESYAPRTLESELASCGRLGVCAVAAVGLALAEALAYLHSHRLIHRDIKPSNVVFVGGHPKFADIGLVTDLRSSQSSISFVGTPGYMPPEGPGTAAGDIYALGKLLYVVMTGLSSAAFPEMPTALLEGPEAERTWPLQRILLQACAIDPLARHPSAAALADDLRRLLSASESRA